MIDCLIVTGTLGAANLVDFWYCAAVSATCSQRDAEWIDRLHGVRRDMFSNRLRSL
jgi:hypothetical protein